MKLKNETFIKVCPKAKNPEAFVEALNTYMPKFGITTADQIAMFLAQATHESGHFTAFVENLNYSAVGLANTWPARYGVKGTDGKYIKGKANALALSIARDPRKIANNVYANRMGNGSDASGEGYAFRGRGIFQLTGKDNYTALDKDCPELKVLANPDILTQCPEAVISACWYWSKNKLNRFATDIVACTKAINGGTIGLEDRKQLYTKIKAELV